MWTDEIKSESAGGAGFWEGLTNMIFGAGQQYFLGQQQQQTDITKSRITSETIISVAKWLGIIIVVGGILKAIFSSKR